MRCVEMMLDEDVSEAMNLLSSSRNHKPSLGNNFRSVCNCDFPLQSCTFTDSGT